MKLLASIFISLSLFLESGKSGCNNISTCYILGLSCDHSLNSGDLENWYRKLENILVTSKCISNFYRVNCSYSFPHDVSMLPAVFLFHLSPLSCSFTFMYLGFQSNWFVWAWLPAVFFRIRVCFYFMWASSWWHFNMENNWKSSWHLLLLPMPGANGHS